MRGTQRTIRSTDVLASLADPTRPVIAERVLVVVAHPDDETLGCGALLPRLAEPWLVHVTDGAPASGADAARHGFESRAAYASARRTELAEALRLVAVPDGRTTSLAIADQDASRHLAAIARALVPMLAGCDVVVTHAYEGGHPDHDAVAFAVSAAARLAERSGPVPAIVEMPLYRAGPDGGWLRQSFAEVDGQAIVSLDEGERHLKRAMADAHASQRDTLSSFDLAHERYRLAHDHDFAALPNGGRVLYDGFGWQTTSRNWPGLVVVALAELGLA